MSANKKILVVGGAGYIGSHAVLDLLDQGFEVTVFDNLSRGQCVNSNSTLIVGDLRSRLDLSRLFNSNKFDLVMHFAALAYVGESVESPKLYYENNVIGTLNLLSSIIEFNKPPLVFSSSCATYGEPKFTPISESHPQLPINPYGYSKLWIEQALKDYAKAYGQKSISLRYFNAAGCDPLSRAGELHEPETHLIPLVLKEALRLKQGGDPNNTSLCVYGSDFSSHDGSCVRDFIHVSDISAAHSLAAKRLLNNESNGAEFYNLSNGCGFSVLDIISACQRVTGQPIKYKINPRREGDPEILVGDGSLASKILGWKPNFTEIDSIIKSAWAWLINQ